MRYFLSDLAENFRHIIGPSLTAGGIIIVFIILATMMLMTPSWIRNAWEDHHRPASDYTRVAAYMSARGERVETIEPAGTGAGMSVRAGGDNSLWMVDRRYDVVVRFADGRRMVRTIGVRAGSRRVIYDYDIPEDYIAPSYPREGIVYDDHRRPPPFTRAELDELALSLEAGGRALPAP